MAFPVPEFEGAGEVLGGLADGLPLAFEEPLVEMLPDAVVVAPPEAMAGEVLPGGLAEAGVEVPAVCGALAGLVDGGGVGEPADAVGPSGFAAPGPSMVVPTAFAGCAGAAGSSASTAAP